MESSSGLGAKVAIPRLKQPGQQTVLLRPLRIRSEIVDKACAPDLDRATHKSEVLSTLLKDIRGALNDEYTKRFDDIFKEFENDTPPLSSSVNTRSWKKQLRMPLSDEMDSDRQASNEA
ncbi:uncharacterized protein yc1106_01273 [Curvularia clavata]|uniref:Uncharacterized protein n=1 Tax=Curvularia clavata TaxID=95742 RepID=A0A9Q8Z360_CURCL|nr:uncharacterized protein yc1106_01273 [Curvularia clavata]